MVHRQIENSSKNIGGMVDWYRSATFNVINSQRETVREDNKYAPIIRSEGIKRINSGHVDTSAPK